MPEPTTSLLKAAAEPLEKEAKGLLIRLFGPTFEEFGAMLAEPFRLKRLERGVVLLRKAERIMKENHLPPKAINMKILLPLLDAGTLEEDEDMAERWASLLASA